jgi:hypothetical protein
MDQCTEVKAISVRGQRKSIFICSYVHLSLWRNLSDLIKKKVGQYEVTTISS